MHIIIHIPHMQWYNRPHSFLHPPPTLMWSQKVNSECYHLCLSKCMCNGRRQNSFVFEMSRCLGCTEGCSNRRMNLKRLTALESASNRVIVFVMFISSRVLIAMHLLHIIVSIVLLTVNGYHLPLSKCKLNGLSTSEFVNF